MSSVAAPPRAVPSDLFAAYPEDREVMAALGLRVEDFRRDREYDHLGTVEFDNGYAVAVSVACVPAQHWRLVVAKPDGSTRVIDCNTKPFRYHWRTKALRAVRGGTPVPRSMVAAAQGALEGNPSGRVVALTDARTWAARGSRGATHLVMRWQRHWYCSCGASGDQPCGPMRLVRDEAEAEVRRALRAYEDDAR